MTDNLLAFIDTETTGLDARIHQAWEVCVWREDLAQPLTYSLAHSLGTADARALEIGGYWQRYRDSRPVGSRTLAELLLGCTLVGANPAFDQAFLTRFIGAPVWAYRLIDVCTGAMWLFGWERPKSLIDTADYLREMGHAIYQPDHTAEGDVRAVRDVYQVLRDLGAGEGPR